MSHLDSVGADFRGSPGPLLDGGSNPRGGPAASLTLDENECEAMLEHGRLKVLAAPVDQVFLMKLDSDRHPGSEASTGSREPG